MLTERHFTQVDKHFHNAWLTRVVDSTPEVLNVSNVVSVIGNTPCPSRLKNRADFDYLISRVASVLKLGPYSAPLSPIEMFWNTMKQ